MSSPQKKTKLCPHFRKPCIEGDCTYWVGFPVDTINELTGTKVTETRYNCNDLWATKIAFDWVKFADQAGASLDKLTNQVADGNAQIGGMIFEQNRRLNHARSVRSLRAESETQEEGPESPRRLPGLDGNGRSDQG